MSRRIHPLANKELQARNGVNYKVSLHPEAVRKLKKLIEVYATNYGISPSYGVILRRALDCYHRLIVNSNSAVHREYPKLYMAADSYDIFTKRIVKELEMEAMRKRVSKVLDERESEKSKERTV